MNAKITEQRLFVASWDAGPGQLQHENQHTLVVPLEGRPQSVEETEKLTGISKQAVSRWRISLRHPEKYRERIMRGSMRAAANHRIGTEVARQPAAKGGWATRALHKTAQDTAPTLKELVGSQIRGSRPLRAANLIPLHSVKR